MRKNMKVYYLPTIHTLSYPRSLYLPAFSYSNKFQHSRFKEKVFVSKSQAASQTGTFSGLPIMNRSIATPSGLYVVHLFLVQHFLSGFSDYLPVPIYLWVVKGVKNGDSKASYPKTQLSDLGQGFINKTTKPTASFSMGIKGATSRLVYL